MCLNLCIYVISMNQSTNTKESHLDDSTDCQNPKVYTAKTKSSMHDQCEVVVDALIEFFEKHGVEN